jgi:hypothetical protein
MDRKSRARKLALKMEFSGIFGDERKDQYQRDLMKYSLEINDVELANYYDSLGWTLED